MKTDSVPKSAPKNRQPNGLSPKSFIPAAMNHFPTG